MFPIPLDALCLSGLVHELDQTVTGGKIDKIYQPGRDEILLAVRTPAHGNVRLLLSANPNHPRPQLTQISRENPDTPPMFCMLLRKHLSGARLLAVEQPPLERVVIFTLEALNELGDRVERRLALEAIGRRRGMLVSGGEVNTERAAIMVVDEFRASKWGRISLEQPPREGEKPDDQ